MGLSRYPKPVRVATKVRLSDGKVYKVWVYGRQGNLSEESWYLRRKGESRLISPFEQRTRLKIQFRPQDFLQIFYNTHRANRIMRELVYARNPFLELLKKTDDRKGCYLPIPIKFD